MKKVVIFGLGNTYKLYKEIIHSKYEIVGYTDNYLTEEDAGMNLVSPESLYRNDEINVLICVKDSFLDIFRQLIRGGLPKNRIISIYEIISEVVINESRGRANIVPPPPEYKRMVIKEYAEQFKCNSLIETGTYYGGTVKAELLVFDRIASVELSEELYNRAVTMFKGIQFVKLYCGDSGVLLDKIIEENNATQDVLFWLDGHYSGGETACGESETPIIKEISKISENCKSGVILIDDARCFVGKGGYPTIKTLRAFMNERLNITSWENEMDIIRCIFDNTKA